MILSIIILIFLSFGVILGLKRGFTYQLIKMVGIFLILILSYIFKDKLALVFLNHFNFIDINPNVSIIFYRLISFIILMFIFRVILLIILKISAGFEKFLSATIILGIPSKILGAILGFIEYYIYTFLILLILSLPFTKINVSESKLAITILHTPYISNKLDVSLIEDIKDEFDSTNKEENYLKILKKHNIIKED